MAEKKKIGIHRGLGAHIQSEHRYNERNNPYRPGFCDHTGYGLGRLGKIRHHEDPLNNQFVVRGTLDNDAETNKDIIDRLSR